MTYKVISVIVILSLIIACRPPEKNQVLSPRVRYMRDTMFINQKKALNAELDSLCELNTPLYIETMVDSLLEIERERIQELSE